MALFRKVASPPGQLFYPSILCVGMSSLAGGSLRAYCHSLLFFCRSLLPRWQGRLTVTVEALGNAAPLRAVSNPSPTAELGLGHSFSIAPLAPQIPDGFRAVPPPREWDWVSLCVGMPFAIAQPSPGRHPQSIRCQLLSCFSTVLPRTCSGALSCMVATRIDALEAGLARVDERTRK
jgi:hypothetical protein